MAYQNQSSQQAETGLFERTWYEISNSPRKPQMLLKRLKSALNAMCYKCIRAKPRLNIKKGSVAALPEKCPYNQPNAIERTFVFYHERFENKDAECRSEFKHILYE